MRPPDESSITRQDAVAGDAFGAALMACLEGGARPRLVTEIVERDDGFIDTEDIFRYFAPPADWQEMDRWACDALHGRVLDIGAGAGRHSLALQQRGCDVLALDTSTFACEVSRRRGVRQVFAGTVEELAATSPQPFDGFVLLGNNLGLLRDKAYAPRLLACVATIARPGAMIVGSCLDPYATADPDHLAYHEANRRAGRLAGEVRLRIRHRRLATPWFGYLFASLDELISIVRDTDWRIVDTVIEGAAYVVRMQLDRAS